MHFIDRTIAAIIGVAKWAALAVALLLFAQWPLREGLQAFSREANDLGQWLFALLVAASVTAATRADRHIAADTFARGYAPRVRRVLSIAGIIVGLLPWAVFVGIYGSPIIVRSVAVLERFQDTGNPGYFIVKLALLVLLGLMVAQALVTLVAPSSNDKGDPRP